MPLCQPRHTLSKDTQNMLTVRHLRHLRQKLRKDGLAPVHTPASSSMRSDDDMAMGHVPESNRRNRKSPAIPCLT